MRLNGYKHRLQTMKLGDDELEDLEKMKFLHPVIIALIERRQTLGLSVAELAEKAGCRECTIYNVESGRYNPSVGLLKSIAEALDFEFILKIR